LKTA
jgi:transposase InsO family protein